MSAQQPESPPLPTEQGAVDLLLHADPHAPDAERLATIDRALALLIQPTPFRGMVLCYRAEVLERLGRKTEARTALDGCHQLRPTDAGVIMQVAFERLEEHRPVDTARLIMQAVAIDPHAADAIDASVMETVFRQLGYLRQDALLTQLTGALAASGYGRLDPGTFSDLTFSVLRARMQAGDTKGAIELLPSITTPAPGLKMLIDRQFAPIWPSVEKWAGGDLSLQRQTLLDGAKAAFATTPSPANRVNYAVALASTGHRADAIILLREWLATPMTPTDDAWYRNNAAIKLGRWLAESGQRTQGIAAMRQALVAPASHDPSVMNVVPNLAIQQLLAQDFAGARALLDERTPSPEALETPAAAGYFLALHACADAGSGLHGKANGEWQRVRTVYATVEDAVLMAASCVASPDEQAKLWMARVEDPMRRSAALLTLVRARYRHARGLPPESLYDDMLWRLSERAAVQRAFATYGRDLPGRYEPALVDFNPSVAASPI